VILSPLRGARTGINKLLGGMRSVAGWVNLQGFIPNDLPAFAKGGNLPSREVRNGFVTNQARAIVGEGNTMHPEFVIPTDPKYRQRAMGLFSSAGSKLGVPGYAAGGLISGLSSYATGYNAIARDATSIVNAQPGIFGELGRKMFGVIKQPFALKAEKWINTALQAALDLFNKIFAPIASGGGSWWDAISNAISGSKPTKTQSDSPYTKGPSAHGGILEARAFMNGGIVKGGRGGILSLIGEGRNDEAVIPLNGDMGFGRAVNIYGDVVLPDVTDVDEFLANLESLADA
jgi:hypothetical protein